MRYATYRHATAQAVGLVEGDRLLPVAHDPATGLRGLIADGRLHCPRTVGDPIPLNSVALLPPIPDASKILCVGLNYRSHAKEAGGGIPDHPALFARFNGDQVGHGRSICRPRASHDYDFEGELAVIIAKTTRYVSEDEALAHVAGYACFADNSLRDLQEQSVTGMSGKMTPSSGAFGPWMVTADEIPDPGALSLITRLNGTIVQQGMTSDMIFSVAALISYASLVTQLEPGDVIATGTPAGVGFHRKPPLWMKPGDRLEIEIEKIGTLANEVVDED